MRDDVYEFLTRPKRTLGRIRELEARLKGLEDAMLPKGVSYDRDKVQAPRSDPMARFAERAEALCGEIDELRMRYLDETREIEDALSRLEDDRERAVLAMRYLCRMSYEAIAEAMHYSVDRIYQLHRAGTRRLQ